MLPLHPVTTETTINRTHVRDCEPCTDTQKLKETRYILEKDDEISLYLSSLIVTRGCRYNGTEETLRLENYGEDLFKSAIIKLICEMQATAIRGDSDYLKSRATDFIAEIRNVLL
jgi:heterodisulfide reductase subunit B